MATIAFARKHIDDKEYGDDDAIETRHDRRGRHPRRRLAGERFQRTAATQATPRAAVETGRVETEGDELVFDVRGQGAPLLLIPGGMGDAQVYSLVAELLAPEYTVITYDPRGYGRSTSADPQNFEVGQQARDVVAVLAAAGYDAALIFGSSSGAVVGLELAKSQPHAVAGLIPHEPPAIRVLPDADEIQTEFAEIYLTAWREGPEVAFFRFIEYAQVPVNEGEPLSAEMIEQVLENPEVGEMLGDVEPFVRYQMLTITNYKPDVEMIKENGVPVVMAVGEESLDKIYGRTVPILAEELDCPMETFPGHHVSYVEPDGIDEWIAALREALGLL